MTVPQPAEVVPMTSARKHEYGRALGATPVDYRDDDVPARVREISLDGVHAVFDHVGGPGLVQSWRMLRRGGTLVTHGSASTLSGTGHWIKPYLPTFACVLLWNALSDGKRATSSSIAQGAETRLATIKPENFRDVCPR